MKIRHAHYLMLIIYNILVFTSFLSALYDPYELEEIGLVARYIMLFTIIFGILIAIYIRLTKNQLFDPLNTDMDSDPTCEEDDEIKLS